MKTSGLTQKVKSYTWFYIKHIYRDLSHGQFCFYKLSDDKNKVCTLSHAVQYLAWSPGEGHAFIMMENATIKQPRSLESATKQWENEVPILLCTQ